MNSQRKRLAWRWSAIAALSLTSQALPESSRAGEPAPLQWHTEVDKAWRVTQQDRRPLLVFVSSKNCLPCLRMKSDTFADSKLARQIADAYVPLSIDGGSNAPLLKDLDIKAYPATFVISPDAIIVDRIDGYLSPRDLSSRLAKGAAAAATAAKATSAAAASTGSSSRKGSARTAEAARSPTAAKATVVHTSPAPGRDRER